MTLLLVGTVLALGGFLALRYLKHPASSLGVFPFLIGMGICSVGLDHVFDNQRYIAVGYFCTLLVAGVGILLFVGRKRFREKRCQTCADPLQPGIQLGVKDLEKTPYLSSEDMGYHASWYGEAVMMSRAKYRCSSCGREFYGKTGYSMLSETLK